MPIPSTPSYAQMPNNLSDLLKIHRDGYRKFSQGLTNLTKVTKLTSKRVKAVVKTANTVKKNVSAVKKITDLLKKGKYTKINPQFGRAIGFALQLASIGLNLLTINHIGNLQAIELKKDGVVQKDLNVAFQNLVRNTLTIRKLRAEYNNFIKQYKADKDRLGADIAGNISNITKTRELSEAAKKQANDALYEAREGRKKVEIKLDKIFNDFTTILQQIINDVAGQNAELANRTDEARQLGNDALYEAREGRKKLEAEFNQKIQAARKLGNDALYETRASRSKMEAFFGKEFNSLRRTLNLEIQKNERKSAQQIKSLSSNFKGIINNAITQAKSAKADALAAKADARSAQLESKGLKQQINQIKADVNKLNFKSPELNIEPTVRRLIANSPQIQGLLAALEAANVKLNGFSIQVPINTQIVKNLATTVQLADGRITRLEKGVELKGLNVVNARISGAESAINNSKIEINKLKNRVKDRENVDRVALGKLEQVLGLLGPIPLLIGKVPSNTVRQMPRPLTSPQIEAAASAGVCRSTRPGGCMSNALGSTADTVNRNTNQWGSNLLNGINTGANAAQLGLLKVIDGKLGPKIGTKGLSGAIKNIFENKLVDRALAVANLATNTHNALMLSNNLAQTLFSATDNILKVVGIKIKDEKGSEIGIQQVVNSLFLNFANSLFGAENVKSMNTTFKKANRIYQAGANIINSVRSITDSVRNVTEFVAENTGKIGNALMRFGTIASNAFPKMPEQVNAQSVWVRRLENLENAASGIEMITSEVLSVTENVKEIKKQTEEFNKGVESLEPKSRKDNKPVKEKSDEDNEQSKSPAIPVSAERKP